MKEKTVEFSSYSTEYLDDGIGVDDPDLDPMISDISKQNTLDDELEHEVQIISQLGPDRHSPL